MNFDLFVLAWMSVAVVACQRCSLPVACQRVLYILPPGFVPIYFLLRVFKVFSKGLQRPFKDHLEPL
ncbi:hypothetical protein CER18_05055 [Bartonella tribocorum]|uniref:Uncharacterized protein n=1 Tax=Bartonella tribocorum TaxID=85701 RepID=A0A2M6URW8_9HYPH|nr:hypothetical protein CER18_05055 [Bartonella tribocorum]